MPLQGEERQSEVCQEKQVSRSPTETSETIMLPNKSCTWTKVAQGRGADNMIPEGATYLSGGRIGAGVHNDLRAKLEKLGVVDPAQTSLHFYYDPENDLLSVLYAYDHSDDRMVLVCKSSGISRSLARLEGWPIVGLIAAAAGFVIWRPSPSPLLALSLACVHATLAVRLGVRPPSPNFPTWSLTTASSACIWRLRSAHA